MRPEQLAFSATALAGGGEPVVRLRWLGAAGFELCAGEHVVLIDPYLSRPSLARCVAGPLQPDRQAIARHVRRADAVVVGHTHFDHALDVAAIAHGTGARVFGSRSAMALCRSAGILARRTLEVEPGASALDADSLAVKVGPFEIAFARSEHGRVAFGRVPLAGDIRDCEPLPLRAEGYRCGTVLRIAVRIAERTIVHLGSAALPDGEAACRPVDLLLLCASGWHTTPGLPERVVHRLAPRAVLLSHWDNFFRPLHRPARALPGLRLRELVERLRRADPHVQVGTLPLLGELEL